MCTEDDEQSADWCINHRRMRADEERDPQPPEPPADE